MGLFKTVGSALGFKNGPLFSGAGSYGYSGPFGWLFTFLPGSQYDYRREAGNLWENSVVAACLSFMYKAFPESPMCIEEKSQGQNFKQVATHPILDLLENPNPFWDSIQLWQATLLSLSVDGNAYWYKLRSKAGKVVELWWMPHWMMDPRWPTDGSKFITYYNYRIDGRDYKYNVEDIVHFKAYGVDPRNNRKGYCPLLTTLREICTDNEIATMAASLARNLGIPGLIISPTQDVEEFSPDERDKMRELLKQRYNGDRRGEALVTSVPIDMKQPGFSPEQLVLDKLRYVPEERICGCFGIPPSVIFMGAGMQTQTFSNVREAREMAYESCIIPLQRILANQVTKYLLPEFEQNFKMGKKRFAFDWTNIRVLDESMNRLYERLTIAYQGGWLRRSEARQVAGWEYDPKADLVYITDLEGVGGDRSLSKLTSDPTVAGKPENPADSQAAENGGPGKILAVATMRRLMTGKNGENGKNGHNEGEMKRTGQKGVYYGKIYLIRHARTKFNGSTASNDSNNGSSSDSPDRIRGWQDIPLSDEGKKEAREVAERVAELGIDCIYSSDLKRAVQTAEIIEDFCNVPLERKQKNFRPWNLGDYQGKRTAEVITEIHKYAIDTPEVPIPGGESFNEFVDRFRLGLLPIIIDVMFGQEQRTIGIVTHFRDFKLTQAMCAADGGILAGGIDMDVFTEDDVDTGDIICLDVSANGVICELIKSEEKEESNA